MYLIWLMLVQPQGHAFTLMAEDLKRNRHTVTPLKFVVKASDCGVEESKFQGWINRSLKLWSSVPTSNMDLGTTTTEIKWTADAPNTYTGSISCTDLGPSIGGIGGGSSLVINSQLASNWSDLEAIAVITHEIGHVLGLGHTLNSESVMQPSAVAFASVEYLGQDDIDGVTYLYPRKEEMSGKFLGFACASVARSQRGAAHQGEVNTFALAEFLMLIVFSWFAAGLVGITDLKKSW